VCEADYKALKHGIEFLAPGGAVGRDTQEVMMTRNTIISVIVIELLIVAFFFWRASQTEPQSIPTSTSEPKK